jgi:hypothetical protein
MNKKEKRSINMREERRSLLSLMPDCSLLFLFDLFINLKIVMAE